jgi:hypothetical protein
MAETNPHKQTLLQQQGLTHQVQAQAQDHPTKIPVSMRGPVLSFTFREGFGGDDPTVKFGERALSDSPTEEEHHPPKRARVMSGGEGEAEADAGVRPQVLQMVSAADAGRLEGWVWVLHGHGLVVDDEVVDGGFEGGGAVDGEDETEMEMEGG